MKLAIFEEWHDRLLAGDVAGVAATAAADVALVGPRGTAHGCEALVGWVKDSGIELEPQRWFCGDGIDVVVAHVATWPDGAQRTAPAAVATHFVVDEVVRRIERFDDLDEALTAAGLDRDDEVTRAGRSPWHR